jgi:hypothetical protein
MPNQEKSTNEDMTGYYVLNWYTTLDGKKYLVSTNKDCAEIGRIVQIEDVLKSE